MGRSCQKDSLLTVESWIEDDCNAIAKVQIFGNFDEAEVSLSALQGGGVSLYMIIVLAIVVISLVITAVVSSIRVFCKGRD